MHPITYVQIPASIQVSNQSVDGQERLLGGVVGAVVFVGRDVAAGTSIDEVVQDFQFRRARDAGEAGKLGVKVPAESRRDRTGRCGVGELAVET